MSGKVLLVVVRYLVVAVALLHVSRGARPRLQVVYGLNDVDNQNELECYDGDNFRRAGATYTFRDPDRPDQIEYTDVAEGTSYTFTIQSTNESLVSCTIGSEESDRVMVAAIPQYRDNVTAIRQYVYSDSGIAEIECPFPLGRLSSLYTFSWERVLSSGLGVRLRSNDTRGVYWLDEEYNRTLHVNISAAPDRRFQCVGAVQTCSGISCRLMERPSPIINITDNTDLATITDPPTSITVNESESATFDCTATDVGDLTIEWDVGGVLYNNETCSDTCGSINTVNNNRHVTSTLAITGETDLDISCVVIQRSMTSSSNEPGVEMRLYGRLERAAQLMVIPTVTTAATTQPETTQPTNTQGPDVGRTDDPNPNANPLNANGIYTVTGVIGSFILIIILILAVCIFGIFRYHYKNKESQLGRKLRRTFSRDPHAMLERYTPRDPSPRQYDLEIQGTDTPPITYTHVPNGNNLLGPNSDQQQQIYNISQNSGVSGVSSYSGMSGVSQNHGPHQMPQFGDPSVHLSLPPGTNGNHYVDHHSASSRRTSDTSGSIHSGYSHGHQPLYHPTALHSSHNVINQQQQQYPGGHPESASLPGLQYVGGGYPILPYVASDIHHPQAIDPLSSLPVLSQYPPNGAYPAAYPQLAASQPLQTAHSDRAHSMHSNHSSHSHKSSGRQSPASAHGQHVQHQSPHMQAILAYQPPQPPQPPHFISPNDLATVHFALMHNRHCQIPGCCCYKVRELVEVGKGRMPYDSPEMSISSRGSGNSRLHKVSHQVSSTDSDSDYSSSSDRRSRPPNLRLLSDEHNRNPNLHPHFHLTTKSHMRRVGMQAPVDHRRSKSLSDLTPLTELPETPAKTPAIGGSIKAGTPVYCCQEDAPEQAATEDCHCPNQPMLLREISISADNIPALCLNDCPFTPSPLKEGCRALANTPGRRRSSFRKGSMRSTKPKLKTVKEKTSSAESDDSNTSSRSNTPIKSSLSDDEGIDIKRHHSQELKTSSREHTKIIPDTTLTNKAPEDNAHKTLVDNVQKSSLGIESSPHDRSSDDEVREIFQNAPARDVQKKLSSSHSPLLGRKNDGTNLSYLSSNGTAMSDPRMRRSTSPLSIGSASQVSVHSRRSASPYETEVRKQNGVVMEITEC